MKDIIRLGVILAVICAVAAGALAYTNQITSAIIAERIRQETIAQLQELFPSLADFETREANGRTGTVALDASGNIVGILAEGTTEGYGGTIRFKLGVDTEGKIVAFTVVSHAETPGLGAKWVEDSYRAKYVGKGVEDDFDAIDNISGATVTSKAVEAGVKKELQEIILAFTGEGGAAPAPSFSMDGVADGTYTGTAKGFLADVTVEVTVAGGKITAVTVTEQNDTPDKFDEAEDVVINQIIEKQTVQVDAASGATGSSDAIMKAVQNALAQ